MNSEEFLKTVIKDDLNRQIVSHVIGTTGACVALQELQATFATLEDDDINTRILCLTAMGLLSLIGEKAERAVVASKELTEALRHHCDAVFKMELPASLELVADGEDDDTPTIIHGVVHASKVFCYDIEGDFHTRDFASAENGLLELFWQEVPEWLDRKSVSFLIEEAE